jgi:hypothetical protein
VETSVDALMKTAAGKPVISLWSPTMPGIDAGAIELQSQPGKYTNIKNPSLTVYAPPASRHNGTAIVICPGGGYGMVS